MNRVEALENVLTDSKRSPEDRSAASKVLQDLAVNSEDPTEQQAAKRVLGSAVTAKPTGDIDGIDPLLGPIKKHRPGQLTNEELFKRLREVQSQIKHRDGASFNSPFYIQAASDYRYRLQDLGEIDNLVMPDSVRRYLFPEDYQ
jgi:hypothetical protein